MHILLTNDDGIEAPGLWALLRALRGQAKVTVLAPDHNWSAAGHTKTMHKPLRVRPYSFNGDIALKSGEPVANESRLKMDVSAPPAFVTTGTPSDCVALAMLGILDERPELVVSGINQGANLGYDLTYSGTVAAAMEAAIYGLPAIAVSLDSYVAHDFDFAAEVAAWVVRMVSEKGLPSGAFLNVNVPYRAREEVAGVAVTRLGRRVYHDLLIEREDPRGRPYYWIGGEPPSGHEDEGTDIWAVAHGYVSITPVHLDMTAHGLVSELEGWDLSATG
jgi:5'-nucleotidase